MALQAGLPLTTGWIAASLALYVLTGVCWLPVVWLQMRLRAIALESEATASALPPLYFKYLRVWFLLGWPAFLAVLATFYFMIFKPDITFPL
jgi:uncharacterized membrane protein